jgi:transcriptional regulator with XRE-family HTH domain
MLHAQIRQARVDHGLSQSELARRAGIPRDRLRQFENGENITVDTLMKILAQLPNLQSVTLGAVEGRTTAVDLTEIRDAVAEWLESGRRVLALVESAMARPRPGTGGATRIEPSVELTPELEARLARLEAGFKASRTREA